MDLQKQVVSLTLAKKLKELGVKQESVFYYTVLGGFINGIDERDRENVKGWKRQDGLISAYTVAELGEILPDCGEIKIYKFHNWAITWIGEYSEDAKSADYYKEDDKNLADCVAKMVIYLKENGLI